MTAQPVPRRQRHIIAATIALAAIPMSAIAMGFIMSDLRENVIIVGLCAGFLSYFMVLFGLRVARTAHGAALGILGLAVASGIFNSPFSFIIVGCFESTPGPPELIVGALFATLVGAFIAVPLGLLFGIVFMPLIGLTYGLSRDPAHEALDRTIRICGVWLFFVGGLCGFLAIGLLAEHRVGDVAQLLLAGSLGLAVIAAAAAAASHVSLWSRRSWIERVRQGAVPGWLVVPASQLTIGLSQLRPLFVTYGPDAVLVKRKTGVGAGAYRTGELLEPRALL